MDLFSTAYHLRCCSKSSTPAELLKARLHAIEFVTLPDSFWLDWLDDALNEGDSSHLPMVISAAISMRPSEQVIRCSASCLATPTLPHDIRRNLVDACIDVAPSPPL